MVKNVCIIGSGNVGTHLAKAFAKKGLIIDSIFSRKKKNARALATSLRTHFTDDLCALPVNSDLYLLCVPDGAIKDVSKTLKNHIGQKSIICHTSGSVDSKYLLKHFKYSGVLYPLQSFSKHRRIKISEVPFFISSNSKKVKKDLKDICTLISAKSEIITDQQRLVLHVSAVFANNFSNYLFRISNEILNMQNLHFDAIRPLIKETANKVQRSNPDDMQTGPASRNDVITMEKHLKYLKNHHPEFEEIYHILSDYIQKHGKK